MEDMRKKWSGKGASVLAPFPFCHFYLEVNLPGWRLPFPTTCKRCSTSAMEDLKGLHGAGGPMILGWGRPIKFSLMFMNSHHLSIDVSHGFDQSGNIETNGT